MSSLEAIETLPGALGYIDHLGEIKSPHDGICSTAEQVDFEIQKAADQKMQSILDTVYAYEASQTFADLAVRGSGDRDVLKQGGVKACKKLSSELAKKARTLYLTAQGYPTEEPTSVDSNVLDAYYQGVNEWYKFRTLRLEPAGSREELKIELELQLEDYI